MRRTRHNRRFRSHVPLTAFSPPRAMLLFAAAPLLFLPVVLVLGLLFLHYYDGVTAGIASPERVIATNGGGARILDRNGNLLYQFLDDKHGYQQWVKLEDVSPWLQKATIAVEDPDFYSNPGINFRGVARAVHENLTPGHDLMQGTGGSSVTQQLAKLLYFSQEERGERTIGRKAREMTIALELTSRYSKDQILEWYLNEVPYGSVFTGIEEASERYFSIPAKDLNLAQAAFLAGLPQSPARYDPITNFPAAKARQVQVLDLMAKHGFLTQAEADLTKFVDVQLQPSPMPFEAPHFVLYVADYLRQTLGEDVLMHGGLVVQTTLDLDLNKRAQELLEEHLSENEAATNAHNGAVVVIEPATGQILAMVGSRDYFRDDIQGQVNNALAVNSPGSTLKPFTYVTAFMQGWGPDWPVVDSPITYKEEDGTTFSPRNPGDGHTFGVIPARQALGNSLNVSAFKTILWVGVDNMVRTAKAMGITDLDTKVGPAVTLGGTDVKLLDLTYGYSVFANNGTMAGAPTILSLPEGNRHLDPISVLQVTDPLGNVLIDNTQPKTEPVIRPEYAYMITNILSNDDNRKATFGTGSVLNIPGWQAAAKSGTSEPFEVDPIEAQRTRPTSDTWGVGYTTDIAVGVWIGNSDNSRMKNMYSTTIAAPLWHDVMLEALKGKTPHDFIRPDGLVEATVCVPSGLPVKPGIRCPTVTGLFAADALATQGSDHWGGEQLDGLVSADLCSTCIPSQIQDWKRYLANEYLSYYGGSYRTDTASAQERPAAPSPTPAASAPPAAPPPAAPPRAVPTSPAPQPTPAAVAPTKAPERSHKH
jgi:membrane peptidoglycan carboxypeptidase